MVQLDEKTIQNLMEEAVNARAHSYSPYSNYAVGAALLGKSGKIYVGCNVENASYSATNCAERTALFSAVAQGEREFRAIAIAGGVAGKTPNKLCPPCGICRQVLSEFCDGDMFSVILGTGPNDTLVYSLKELLPLAFDLDIVPD